MTIPKRIVLLTLKKAIPSIDTLRHFGCARYLLIIYCLCLTGCRTNNPWSLSRIASQQDQFDSTQLTFYTDDPIHGIDLTFLSIQKKIHLYLNIHSIPIPPVETHPKYALVHLVINQQKHSFKALRREGGQRLIIPDAARNLIIDALIHNTPVHIATADYYQTLIEPAGFLKYYKQMQNRPLLNNPFHLPF